jgi:YidC/Oxa1 family membrane protein insertase
MYHTIIFNPLYNGLIGLFNLFPWMDAGIAVIVFTILVKLILFPLSKKAITTQVRMKEIEPELNKIKLQYKDDKQAQSLKTMELYKQKGVNPFSSFVQLLIQLPILYGLYSIFVRSGLPVINHDYLYSFVSSPVINMHFLGLIDVSKPSILLSICASVAQFLQLQFSLAGKKPTPPAPGSAPSVPDMAATMNKQMKFIFPIMIFLISYKISSVIAIYWTVSNLFTLGQELYVRRKLAKKAEKKILTA